MAVLGVLQVYAVDSSSAALAWAQLNVDRLNLASRVLVSMMSSSCLLVACIVTSTYFESHAVVQCGLFSGSTSQLSGMCS